MNERALIANAGPLPSHAISSPAIAGPTRRPRLWIVEFSACALT